MIRLLKRILICISVLLGYIPLYASASPADSLVDRYVNRLTKAVNSKIKADRNKSEKDYLLVYDDPAQTFYSDYVNNGQYFWFNGNTTLESQVRSLVNTVQAQTGTEHLYVVLASIYNYAKPEEVSDIKWSSVKAQNKYEAADVNASESIWKSVIPKIRQNTKLLSTNSVLYIISYFTNINGTYKVSHRCFYHGSSSLVVNGFQINATDYVSKTNGDKTDQNSLRIGFLKQTIQAAANSIAKFNADFKQVNEDFAKLAPDSRGVKFYNDYKDLCPDQLILKKLALLINSMDYDAYVAYLSDKKTGDGYYPAVFRGFYDNLYKFNENFKEITKLLPEITSPSQLVKALDVFSEGELAALKYPGRIRAITILNKLEELNDNSWWQLLNTSRWVNFAKSESGQTVVSSEDLMIALISTTPDDQQPSLMEDLKGTDKKYKLLKDIFKKMDDEPVGEGNYSKLMGVLAPMVVKNATAKALDDLYTRNRIFSWENGKMQNIIQDESKAPSATVTLNGQSITLNPQFAFYQYMPKYDEELGTTLQKYGVGKPKWDLKENGIFQPPPAPPGCTTCADIPTRIIGEDDALEPFDLIAIIPTTDINFNTGFSVAADQISLLPGFFIQWYLKKVDNKEIKHNVNMTLAAVSLATGVGGFVSAATLGARILIVAETFFAITAIVGEEYPAFNNFMKENLGTTGFQIFKAVEFGVNMFSAAKGVASLGAGAYNTAKKLSTLFVDLVKSRPDFLAKLRAAYPARFNQLRAWLSNKDIGGIDVAAIANTAGKAGGSAYKGLDFMADYKIVVQVTEESSAYRASRLSGGDDIVRESGASFFEPGGGSGGSTGGSTGGGTSGSTGGGGTGGGTATATASRTKVVMETQKMAYTLEDSRELIRELALKQLLTVSETPVNLVQVTEFTPALAGMLQAEQVAQKVAKLKILQNVTATAKAVVVTVEEADYFLYAQGEAKTVVETYVQTKQKEKDNTCKLCTAEPLICSLEQRSTYASKVQALTKLCTYLPFPQLKPVCMKLNGLPVADLNTFLSDVVNNTPAGTSCTGISVYLAQSIPLLTPAFVDAWKIYLDASRSCLRISYTHLNKLQKAMRNTQLRSAPFSLADADFVDIAKACAAQKEQTAIVDNEIFENLDELASRRLNITGFGGMLSNLENSNPFFTVTGGNYVIRYMQQHSSEFSGYTNIRFEETTVFAPQDLRIADLVVTNGNNDVYYEFKSYATNSLPPSTFMQQFTNDIRRANVNSFNQMKWLFDGTKTTRNDVYLAIKNELLKPQNQALLNNVKTFSMFDQIAVATDSEYTVGGLASLVTYLENDAGWFDYIFKIVP
ncbi:MAG TPA: hypothetical protein VIM87_08520 [Chitinophaga sp.]|uniref:hypothetical protein n=1 Tax=Chitinophaga sp. TaxID=1869181 RepID=UPI002F9399A4